MLILTAIDTVQVVTSGAVKLTVQARYVDYDGTVCKAGKQNTTITSATTTDIVGSPASGSIRNVKSIVFSKTPTDVNAVIIQRTDGKTVVPVTNTNLPSATASSEYTTRRAWFNSSTPIKPQAASL